MMVPAAEDASLDRIRREIDAIDDGIVELIARRIRASEKVRDQKTTSGALAISPIRPSREAAIMRRLLDRHGKTVPAELLVRLWRVILAASTLAQAKVTLHASAAFSRRIELRLRLRDHFGEMPVADHRDDCAALAAVAASSGDVGAVAADGPWADAFAAGCAGAARIICALPVLRDRSAPDILIFGHAQAVPSGDDETVLVHDGEPLPSRYPEPLWLVMSGSRSVMGIPGFLSERDAPFAGRVRIAGSYPSPIEVKS